MHTIKKFELTLDAESKIFCPEGDNFRPLSISWHIGPDAQCLYLYALVSTSLKWRYYGVKCVTTDQSVDGYTHNYLGAAGHFHFFIERIPHENETTKEA